MTFQRSHGPAHSVPTMSHCSTLLLSVIHFNHIQQLLKQMQQDVWFQVSLDTFNSSLPSQVLLNEPPGCHGDRHRRSHGGSQRRVFGIVHFCLHQAPNRHESARLGSVGKDAAERVSV